MKQFKDSSSSRLKNMKQLYKIIRKFGPVTKGELIDITGFKQTTCARFINELLQERLIIESGVEESSGGRKPIMYKINSSLYYSIGVDISRTFTKVLLLDLNLTIKEEARVPMDKTSTPDKTITFIENVIEQMMEKHQIKLTQLLGIGIGAIEPLDREKGIIVSPINFPARNWSNVKIAERLENKFRTKVLVDIAANTAVLAEHEVGFNGIIGNLAYGIAGVGIRVGIMTDHHLFQGSADRYGKYGNGHMSVNPQGKKCVCGNYGCVHTYSTILFLLEEVVKHLKRGHSSILLERVNDFEDIEFKDICWAMENNDALCSHIIQDFGMYTGIGLANIITLIQPDLFILGGPMYNRLDLFYETVTKTAIERINNIYPGYEVKFSRGKLGENAAAVGAGSMMIDYYLE